MLVGKRRKGCGETKSGVLRPRISALVMRGTDCIRWRTVPSLFAVSALI